MIRSTVVLCLLALLPLSYSVPAEPPPRTDLDGYPLPPGAVTRLGTIELRNFSSLGYIPPVFSPDGKLLVTKGPRRTLRISNWATGKLLREAKDADYYAPPFFLAR